MKKAASPKSFEEAVARLEAITQAMQGNELSLEDALAAYKEGNEMVRFCQQMLADVEQQLQGLGGDELKELTLNDD